MGEEKRFFFWERTQDLQEFSRLVEAVRKGKTSKSWAGPLSTGQRRVDMVIREILRIPV